MYTSAAALARQRVRIFRPSHDPTRPILAYITDITGAIDGLFQAGYTLDAHAVVDNMVAHLHPSWAKVRDKLERRGGKRDDLLEVVTVLLKYQETKELKGLLKEGADRGLSPALISDCEKVILARKLPVLSCDVPADHQGAISPPKQISRMVLGPDTVDQPIPEFSRGADGSSFTTRPSRELADDAALSAARIPSFLNRGFHINKLD